MIKFLKSICLKAIINKIPILHKQISTKNIEITETKFQIHGHFQLNNAMKIAKTINTTPIDIAEKIKTFLEKNYKNSFEKIEIIDPGFINFTISKDLINKKINILLKNKNNYVKQKKKKLKIIIDYSSPNIAKEMHVGHLRSTIIGECIARLLESVGHKIIRTNHIGDWGTQFGILINYIKANQINIKNTNLKKLSEYYTLAQEEFNNNQEFKNNCKNEVIKLQQENKDSIDIWTHISKISKKEYKKIYKILDVKLITRGESFYRNLLSPIVKLLTKKNIVETSNGAKCIYLKGYKNKENTPLPLIIQKSDNGFNYATTDLAALNYRINKQKANVIIYVTDIGQKKHFEMIFKTIKKAKLNSLKSKIIHIGFGLMLKNDGKKIKTRSGQTIKLRELLKTAILKTKIIIKEKNPNLNKKELNNRSKIIGINTIKYSDLSNNIKQDYIFDFEKMIKFNGNTATFLLYAYVRTVSINKNIKKKISTKKINLTEKLELSLALQLIQYNYNINKAIKELNPTVITNYLYKVSEDFHIFFQKCKIINSENENSRILLCKITNKILKHGLEILGLKTVEEL